MAELAVTAMGADQPGIVAAVARVLHERGGNIEDSAMTILGGRFSMVLLVEGDDTADDLQAALREATADLGLDLHVTAPGAARDAAAATHLLSVYGSDQPGILARVATALADVGANVTDLSSRLIGATDEPVYALVVELSSDDEQAVRDAVAAAAGELEVDWTLRAIDDVTYYDVTARDAVLYPSRVLKGVCGPVGSIGDPERQLAQDLTDTMYDNPGCVGVAAPQIGVPSRAFCLDVSVMRKPPDDHHGLVVLFDPELVVATGSDRAREGCLSVPDYTCDVRRATDVVVRGTTPEGSNRVIEATGFEARALQHELDHLDGLLILDRVASARTDVHRRKRYLS